MLPPEQMEVDVALIDTAGTTEITVTFTGVLELSHPLMV